MSLRTAVADFRTWAENVPASQRSGEWECHYERWHELYAETEAFIEESEHEDWSPADKRDLLYVLARDNEDGIIADALRRRPEMLVAAARDALSAASSDEGDFDARWQLAAMLGELGVLTSEIEALLLRFVADEHEYVRRHALLALASIGSRKTERHAVAAWDSGEIGQRIAALAALHQVGSALLQRYLDLAFEDGTPPLVTAAFNVMARV